MADAKAFAAAQSQRTLSLEKAEIAQKEYLGDVELEHDNLDYSGSHKKTDPAEIALVKRLDMFIMPTLWAMYDP